MLMHLLIYLSVQRTTMHRHLLGNDEIEPGLYTRASNNVLELCTVTFAP